MESNYSECENESNLHIIRNKDIEIHNQNNLKRIGKRHSVVIDEENIEPQNKLENN